MAIKPKNPLAFPRSIFDSEENKSVYDEDGMTLRDYFAANASIGVMSGKGYDHVVSSEDVAKWSYNIADAMLAERSKEND